MPTSSPTWSSHPAPLATTWQAVADLGRQLADASRLHVPTETFLDYAFGGLDDELLEGLHGAHLAACPSCSHGREIYRRERPEDPALLMSVPEFSRFEPRIEQYQLTSDAASQLREFISGSSEPLIIVAGEANPAVYNHDLAECLRRRAMLALESHGFVPQIVCGPAMGLSEEVETPADALLPGLAEEGMIKLFVARRRQRLHFRVSGDELVYTEAYHEAGNPADRKGYWYTSAPIARLFKRRFQTILDAGAAIPATRGDFVYLSMDRIRELQAESGDFDSLTREQLISRNC